MQNLSLIARRSIILSGVACLAASAARSAMLFDANGIGKMTVPLLKNPQAHGGLPSTAAALLGGATYTIDGSVGQTYSAPAGMTGVQWYRKVLASPFDVTLIAGATAATYVATSGDIGTRLVARGTISDVVTDAISLMPVLSMPVILDDFETLTGRTTNGTGALLELDTTDKLRGTSSLKVTTGTVTGNHGQTSTLTLNPADLGVVVVAYKRAQLEAFSQITESIAKTATASGNANNINQKSQAWSWLAFDTTPTLVGAVSGATTIRDFVNLTGVPSAPLVVKFDAKLSNAKGRTFVMASFDDGYEKTFTDAFPFLDGLGIKAITYHAPSKLNGGGSGVSKQMTLAMQQALYAAGWDCGTDSGMNDEGLAGLTPQQAVDQVNAVRAWNAANIGTRGAEFMCYSLLQWTEEQAAALVAAGYKMCRGGDPGSFHTRFGILPGHQGIYPSQGFTSATPANYPTSLNNAIALLDAAVATGANVSYQHHFVTDEATAIGTPFEGVFKPLYTRIAQFRDQGLLDVGTPTQLVARDGIGPRFPI